MKTQNTKPTLYENVKVWVAQGKHYPVANARIKDFKYEPKSKLSTRLAVDRDKH